MFKKIISLMLACILTLSVFPHSQAYASESISTNENIQVRYINPSEYILSINDEEAIITYSTENNITTVNVTEKLTGDTYFYIRNENNNTLYSSLTDTTTTLSEDIHTYSNDNINTFATKKYIGKKQVSTGDIAAGVIANASLLKIATYILTFIGLFGASATAIVDCLTEFAIASALDLHKRFSYVELDAYESTRTTTKNGKQYTYKVYSYTNVKLIKR